MVKVGIIGATGYAGAELVRLLVGHPEVEIVAVGSVSFEGQSIAEIYPSLSKIFEKILVGEDEVIAQADVVFTSVPHGLSEKFAIKCKAQGKKMIDLGADFRLDDASVYTEWYKAEYTQPELHQEAAYGMPELFREQVKKAKIVGNPGCYPTSVALGLAPALGNGIISAQGIVIDAKSGVTGAGRGLAQNTHYPDCNEAFAPYKIAAHRHTPEIEQTLAKIADCPATVTFVPHLLPVNRGILSTMYAKLLEDISLDDVLKMYEKAYAKEEFVRVCKKGQIANIKNVRMSNYCDISIHMDAHTKTLIVVSAIDNMVKGAAGQAIQNMNLMFDLPENCGLKMVPPAF